MFTTNANGYARVTVVDGSTRTGLYAADGSINIVERTGDVFIGLYHPCGAINVVAVDGATRTGLYHSSGALNAITGEQSGKMFHSSGALQVNQSIGTVAAALVNKWSSDGQGFAMTFEDGASVYVKHTATPANNISASFESNFEAYTTALTRDTPALKMVRYGDAWNYQPHNLAPHSNDMRNWNDVSLGGEILDAETFTMVGTGGLPSLNHQNTDTFTLIRGFNYQVRALIWTDDPGSIGHAVRLGVSMSPDPNQFTAFTALTDTPTEFTLNVNTSGLSAASVTATCRLQASALNGTIRVKMRDVSVRRTPVDDSVHVVTTTVARYALPIQRDADGLLDGLVVEPSRTNLFLNSRAPATQDITVAAAAHVLSFIGTGSIALSGAHTATLVGTGANDRVTLSFTPTAGTLTCTVTGSVDLVQVEAGLNASTPIETAASTVTRPRDPLSKALASYPFRIDQSTYYFKGEINQTTHVADILGQTTAARPMTIVGTRLEWGAGGDSTDIINPFVEGTTYKAAIAHDTPNTRTASNGTAGATSTNATDIADETNPMGIGSRGLGLGHDAHAVIREIMIIPDALTTAQLEELTT